MVTSGAVHGLRLVFGAVLSPGDRVIVESPSYPLALDAIRGAGGRAVPVPIEAVGWDAGAFADAARSTGARAAYLMPDFHNPTGRLMDAETRRALASALTGAGCTIVVDETMADLDLRGPSAPAAPHRSRPSGRAAPSSRWARRARPSGAGCASAGCGRTRRSSVG